MPSREDLAARVTGVLAVLYLIFNEGYLASAPGKQAVRSDLTAEGHALVRARLASGQAPGRYQILAAINAVHIDARGVRDTDWSQVIALYGQLVRLDPSPIVRLNRAIVVAELDGPEVTPPLTQPGTATPPEPAITADEPKRLIITKCRWSIS